VYASHFDNGVATLVLVAAGLTGSGEPGCDVRVDGMLKCVESYYVNSTAIHLWLISIGSSVNLFILLMGIQGKMFNYRRCHGL
jgi:hypothetical protein